MTLSAMFNTSPDRKGQLDALERALDVLDEQQKLLKRHEPELSSLTEERDRWQYLVAKVERKDGKKLDHMSYGAVSLDGAKLFLQIEQERTLEDLGDSEWRLCKAVSGALKGPDQTRKLEAFFSGAVAAPRPASDDVHARARHEALFIPNDVPLKEETFCADLEGKIVDSGIVKREIAQVKALIDDGSTRNKLRRLAWQIGRKFAHR